MSFTPKQPSPSKPDFQGDSPHDSTNKPLHADSTNKPPHARLASVTRKQNEILNLIEAQDPSELYEIQEEYHIYLKRVENLYQAAESHQRWLSNHRSDIDAFRAKIDKILYPTNVLPLSTVAAGSSREQHNDNISENASTTDRSSNYSSTSSARLWLAEQKAKLAARKKADEETARLEKRELDLKSKYEIELLDLKLQKERTKTRQLEEEISGFAENLELMGGQGKGSVSSKSSKRSSLTPNQPAPGYPDLGPSVAVDILQKQNDIAKAMTECQKQAFLPKRELQTFDGSDLTSYKNFVINFDRIIVPSCNDDGDKFLYLQQYTRGKAKKFVDSCVHYDPSTGYKKARAALDTEYGDEFKVANSYIERISNWPSIPLEDAETLHNFAILLFDCNNYLENMSSSNQLQNPKEMLNIVSKLPFKMKDRWRRKTHRLQSSHKEIKFSHLVDFVQEEAAVLKQPLYGNITDTKKFKTQKSNASYNLAATANSESASPPNCPYCKKHNHTLNECRFFGNISLMDKSAFIRRQKLCFGCLQLGHMSKDCTDRDVCKTCEKRHPTTLHNPDITSSTERKIEDTSNKTCANKVTANRVVCPVVPAKISVKGKENKILVNCALDTCSTDCWINESLLHRLGLFAQKTNLKVSTMTQKNTKIQTKVVNNLQIFDIDEISCTTLPVVFTKPQNSWPFSRKDLVTPEEVSQYQHLAEIPFNLLDEEVGLLIGMSAPELLKPLEIMDGEANELFASRYRLGWTVGGPVKTMKESNNFKMCNRLSVDDNIVTDLERYYNKDFEDYSVDKCKSYNDKQWLKSVQDTTIKLPNKHFQIDLPLIDKAFFPNNRNQVLKTFLHLKRRLDSKKDFMREYSDFMNNMLSNNYAEKVSHQELASGTAKFYIPHHGVYHKTKRKLRVVFNCSLKFGGISLNDNLNAGPDLTNNLLGVLQRFRQDRIAFVADIQKMFYQVFVPKQHSDLMRFFWLDDSGEVAEYRIKVHVFGSVSSPSIANFALRSSVNNIDSSLEARSTILRNFYVDDCLRSFPSEEECIETFVEVRRVLSQSGFNLTSVQSNSPKVLSSLSAENETSSEIQLSEDTMALGIIWNRQRDVLKFRVNLSQQNGNNITKRMILQVLASVYDPIGIISPVLTPAKKLFQDTCALNLHWDDPLPPKVVCAWRSWVKEMEKLASYEVQRCVHNDKVISESELHIFCDGGEIAYGAAAYAKFIYEDSSVSTKILASKGRLTPLNNRTLKTIPRVELAAAKLAIELSLKLREEFDYHFETVEYWSDSTTVLKYIKGTHLKFHRFVENKVNFIRNFSSSQQWHYIPSKENPADIVSRGSTPSKLATSQLWNCGPKYLINSEDLPIESTDELPANDSEIKVALTTISGDAGDATNVLIESTSEWQKLRKRIASLLLFRNALLKGSIFPRAQLTVEDLEKAEKEIVKFVQTKYYYDIIDKLKYDRNLPEKCYLRRLRPFIDDVGILRVGGRLVHSDLSYNTKHPIILPSCHVSVLIVRYFHYRLGHLGRETMLAQLRTKYWITKANALVRAVCRGCLICRKLLGKRSEALMADLPRVRLKGDQPPFTDVAVDYFGPFIVSYGRKTLKRYGVIFSCTSSRAVHLEIAHTLTTSSFIQALRRLVSRRGNVKSLLSDNGTNFVGANKELQESIKQWNKVQINNWCLQMDIEWTFNPPSGSHFGGLYERQIKTIRKTLNSIMLEQPIKLHDEELLTLMCEVEAILNNRPLSPISDDPEDMEALTPNHLLLLNAGVTYPPGLFCKDDIYVKRRWRQTQYLADLFWSRWRREYLVSLQQRQKWQKITPSHEVGDLVLVVDANLPRNQWPLGRIVETIPGQDGCVRTARIKISQCKNPNIKDWKCTEFIRPIVKLILLRSLD